MDVVGQECPQTRAALAGRLWDGLSVKAKSIFPDGKISPHNCDLGHDQRGRWGVIVRSRDWECAKSRFRRGARFFQRDEGCGMFSRDISLTYRLR